MAVALPAGAANRQPSRVSDDVGYGPVREIRVGCDDRIQQRVGEIPKPRPEHDCGFRQRAAPTADGRSGLLDAVIHVARVHVTATYLQSWP